VTKASPELPVIAFDSEAAFELWLADNHEDPVGLWLKIAKKASGIESITHAEALDVALCFGWIDGQRRSFDDDYFLQKFTQRRPRSKWSQVNRNKVESLIAAGRMRPAGLAQIQAAKDDDRWDDAYEPQSKITVPEDLQARLKEHPDAREFFESLDSRNRYAILYRLQDAKRPETRARRLEQFVAMLIAGEKLH
jgi:uncharacterized protein YdeI (YjbR/CyaY-like superfamily)